MPFNFYKTCEYRFRWAFGSNQAQIEPLIGFVMAKSNSRLKRLAVLGGLTSKVSSSYLGQRIKGVFQSDEAQAGSLEQLHIENANRVADTMSQIKGAAMKVGQSLALLADTMDLSPELAQIFSKLHDQALAIPFEDIRQVIERELGDIESHFASIDPEPLGTASLAQAHAARLKDGRSVVIKVLMKGLSIPSIQIWQR